MSQTCSFLHSLSLILLSALLFSGCGDKPVKDEKLRAASPPTEAQVAERIRYSQRTFYDDYLQVGKRDPQWDSFASNGLALISHGRITRKTNDLWNAFYELTNAVSHGCTDPIVAYSLAYLRYTDASNANKEQAAEWVTAAEGLEQSNYAPIRKGWGALRAAQALKTIAPTRTNNSPEINHWRESVFQDSMAALAEPDIPNDEACSFVTAQLELLSKSPVQRDYVFSKIGPILMEKFPRSAEAWTIRGEYYISYAWEARGGGYADTVTSQGAKLMQERLAVSEEALDKAWKLKPLENTAVAAIGLELGQGRGRERMERYFQRAMTLNSNSFSACTSKLLYLNPKWYGSEKDLTQFGWECIHSKTWGGKVPLIMLDVQELLADIAYPEKTGRDKYWTRDGVWMAVQSAFVKYFELNPQDVGYRHNQFWYAYMCGRYDVAREILPTLGPINYSFFGGKEKFDQMVQRVNGPALKATH